jgi:Domain of unknown function (DUF4349)
MRTLLLGLLAVLLLAGCTSGKGSSSAGSAGGGGGFAGSSAAAGPGRTQNGSAGGAGAVAPTTALQQRAIVRTGTVDLQVANVDKAAGAVDRMAIAAGGRVDGDNRDQTGQARTAQLIVRVPPAAFDRLIAQVVALGTERSRSIKGEDVTASRANIDARVKALATSVTRLRQLLAHSGTIADLVALEGQLTSREAELESTTAQQRALADQISLATLTAQLRGPAPPPPVVHRAGGPSGFGSALAGGWRGLVLIVRWLLAVLGYVLPIALPLVVLTAGALVLLRRHRRPRPQPQPAPTE